jgi:photosystem II stability/assembly factor-like uncharacterized protein
MRGKISVIAACVALVLAGAGCISFGGGSGSAGLDGGIYKSTDQGDNWTAKNAVLSTGAARSIAGISVATIVQDPNDALAFYLGSTENGMFISYDGAESWFQPSLLTRGRINSIAVHPTSKCTVYATIDNKLAKTVDCSRSWTTPFVDTRSTVSTKAVAVDSYDTEVIWLGESSGDLLKSPDGGASWTNIKGFGNEIMRIAVSPSDTRVVYVATKASGVWRTVDGGENWTDLSPNYKSFSGAKEFMELAMAKSDPRTLIMASKYGLTRSVDGGDNWEKIDLLTPPGQALIYSLAIDPQDANTIYYGTATTFYRSVNGGINWVPKKLPSTRAATQLAVDRSSTGVLFMGLTKFKQ